MLEYPWVIKLGIETVEKLREHFDADPKHRARADQYKANIEKYGAPTWHEWCFEHWGTKGNACDAKVADNGDGRLHISFDTAWGFPLPIIEKLVADFPTLKFEGSGEFVWGEDHDAREAAAKEFEDEDVTLFQISLIKTH